MPLTVEWWDIALRLACGFAAGALVGYDREEQGRVAGLRTMILVCMAATAAMIEANLLLDGSGGVARYLRADVLRLPLGILSGIGFIGAGAIVRRANVVWGVTTAATLWMVTVIGLIFGAGLYGLGAAVTLVSAAVVWGLRHLEARLTHKHHALLTLSLRDDGPAEEEIEAALRAEGLAIAARGESYSAEDGHHVTLRVTWNSRSLPNRERAFVRTLAAHPGVDAVEWRPRDVR